MVDIVCRRYSKTRPSDILGIEDDWTAFQLDSALAFEGEQRDREFVISLVESINDHLVNVMRALGAKVRKKPKQEKKPQQQIKEDATVEEVLALIGGSGTVVNYKKNG